MARINKINTDSCQTNNCKENKKDTKKSALFFGAGILASYFVPGGSILSKLFFDSVSENNEQEESLLDIFNFTEYEDDSVFSLEFDSYEDAYAWEEYTQVIPFYTSDTGDSLDTVTVMFESYELDAAINGLSVLYDDGIIAAPELIGIVDANVFDGISEFIGV